MQQRTELAAHHRRRPRRICLCSDYGWSVGLDTFGDKDPSQARPERIHVQRGTPADKTPVNENSRSSMEGDFRQWNIQLKSSRPPKKEIGTGGDVSPKSKKQNIIFLSNNTISR